jgi:hypothetical protein
MLEACVSLGQIVALRPHQAGFTFGQVETDAAPSRALTQAKSGPYAASSGLHFRSNRTDATLQACAYSGKIVALRRIKRTSSSVKSGPTPRSRRALTQAKSWPYAASSGLHFRSNRDRRHVPGVRLLRPNRGLTPHQADFIFGQIGTGATLQACAYSGQIGALRRIKRTSSSVTTISDGLGSGALNAVRAHAVTYPVEGHLEDYAPLKGVA